MIRFILVFFAFLIVFSGVSRAQEQSLTLEQTLRQVYEDNPSLRASRYGFDVTKELYPQAAAGWKPKLNAEANLYKSRIHTDPDTSGDGALTKNASLYLEEPLYRGGRTTAEIKSAKSRIKAGRARVHQVEQNIFAQTVEVYVNVIRDRSLLNLQRRNKELLAKENESIQARFEAGDITQTDVKQTEAQYAQAMADDVRAQSDLQESEARFEEVTGFWPPEEMSAPNVSFAFPQNIEEMQAMAISQNPDLKVTRQEYQAAQSDIDAAASDLYPQISSYASYLREYDPQPGLLDEADTSTIGLRARMQLYDGGNTLSRRREAKSRAMQRAEDIKLTERSIKGDLLVQWRRLQAFDSEIQAREIEVNAKKLSSEGVNAEARLGERTVLDTLEAEQAVVDAEILLTRAKRDRVMTGYQLAASLGLLLPEHLGMADIAYDPDKQAGNQP